MFLDIQSVQYKHEGECRFCRIYRNNDGRTCRRFMMVTYPSKILETDIAVLLIKSQNKSKVEILMELPILLINIKTLNNS